MPKYIETFDLTLIYAKVADYFGIAMEVGCFIAGLILNNRHSPMDKELLHRFETLRDLFASLFFSSIGLHIFPSFMAKQALLLVVVTVSVMSMKSAMGFFFLHSVIRIDRTTSAAVSIGLSQVSEFGFVLASRAKSMGIVQKEAYYVVVAVTSLSLIITPFIWKVLRSFVPGLQRRSQGSDHDYDGDSSPNKPRRDTTDNQIDEDSRRMQMDLLSPFHRSDNYSRSDIYDQGNLSFWERGTYLLCKRLGSFM